MIKNKQYFLIILTAIFSTLSLILDQGVYQVEKMIIIKEQEMNTYEDLIQTTKQMHIYYDNAKNNLSNQIELQIINLEQNKTFQYFYPYENLKKTKNNQLIQTFEEYEVYTSNIEFNYLMEQNIEQINKVRQSYIDDIEKEDNDIISKLDALRKYLYRMTNIHLADLLDAESVWIYDGDEINRHRFLRQILIVIAFMLNISALLCLLYYFKLILGKKSSNLV